MSWFLTRQTLNKEPRTTMPTNSRHASWIISRNRKAFQVRQSPVYSASISRLFLRQSPFFIALDKASSMWMEPTSKVPGWKLVLFCVWPSFCLASFFCCCWWDGFRMIVSLRLEWEGCETNCFLLILGIEVLPGCPTLKTTEFVQKSFRVPPLSYLLIHWLIRWLKIYLKHL